MSKPALPFLGAGKAEEVIPPWRADFRDTSRLPDLKVVRTDFLVNYGMVSLAVILLSYAGFVEYGHWNMGKEIEDLERDIQSRTVQNTKSLQESGVFTANMAFVDEFVKFKTPRVDCVEVLAALGNFRPEGLTLGNITADCAFVDPKTKKEKVRVVVAGSRKGSGPQDIVHVGREFDRLTKIDFWKKVPGYKLVPPSSPAIVTNTQSQSVDFSFELFLEAK